MKNFTIHLCLLATALLGTFAHADEGTNLVIEDDNAGFMSMLTGNFFPADNSFLDAVPGTSPLPVFEGDGTFPITQDWGTFDIINPIGPNQPGDEIGELIDGQFTSGFLVNEPNCLVMNLDPSLGNLEGFSFETASPIGIDVLLLDADGVTIEEFAFNPTFEGDSIQRAWLNCTGIEVASVVICTSRAFFSDFPLDVFVVFEDISVSFFPPEPTEPTCQDLLQNIIDDLGTVRDLASADDQYLIDWAIHDLTLAQDPIFFETEDRLSDYGRGFFRKMFLATYDLELVSDPMLVEDSLNAIQDLLNCVVAAEVDFAVENGGSERLLDFAEFFDEVADAYSDAGLFLQAVLLHFYAWLFANAA